MNGTQMQYITFVIRRLQIYPADFPIFFRFDGPRCIFMLHEPVYIVICKFCKAGACDIGKFHFRFSRCSVSGTPFSDVGRYRPRGLCHLIILPAARIIIATQIPHTKILGCKLNNICQNPSIKPIITKIFYFHDTPLKKQQKRTSQSVIHQTNMESIF